MSKKEEEIILDNLDYEEYLKAREIYMRKLYKKEAEKSWEQRKGNVEYLGKGVTYATLSDFNHS